MARVDQPYLVEVIRPHESVLATLWVSSLRDYASIRADTEVLLESGSAVADSPYAGLGREVLLPVSWSLYNVAIRPYMSLFSTTINLGL